MGSTRSILVVAVATLVMFLLPLPRLAAAATTAAIPSDFNGDGYADLAIGVPGQSRDAGAVNVLSGSATGLTAGGDQYWTQDSPGIKGVSRGYPFDQDLPGDLFGRALASGDFDRDGYADLAIGAPGDQAAWLTPPPNDVATEGAVNILYGSPDGLTTVDDQYWTRSALSQFGQAWDSIGAALTAADFDGDGFWDLAITGLRWTRSEEGGPITLGAIVLPGGPGGLSAVGAHASIISADAPYGYGYWSLSLAAGDLDGDGNDDLVVGDPVAAVASVGQAGQVGIFYGAGVGLPPDADAVWTQDSPGVDGEASWYDDFGTSLATGDFDADGFGDLAIGVPLEDTSTANDGAVHVLYGTAGGLTAEGGQFWHQDTPGVPGASEHEDMFGMVLAAGDFDGDGADDLAIGMPNERGRPDGAGAVVVLRGGALGLGVVGAQRWTQNSDGVPGTPEAYDRFGLSLASANYGRSRGDDLAVGVPNEEVGGLRDAGVVDVLYGRASGLSGINAQGWSQSSAGVKGTSGLEVRFGWSLSP